MSDHGEAEVVRFGAHTLHFEPPDICHVTFVGDIAMFDIGTLDAAFRKAARAKGWVLVISNMERAGGLSGDVRRAAVSVTPLVRGVTFIQAGFRLRLILSLLNKAHNILNRDHFQSLGFVDTEAGARAWIAERRRTLEVESGSPRAG